MLNELYTIFEPPSLSCSLYLSLDRSLSHTHSLSLSFSQSITIFQSRRFWTQVMAMLNELYTIFDLLVEKYDLYKVFQRERVLY